MLNKLDRNLNAVYYIFMIQGNQINTVSKNNFLSLMRSYESNYKKISKLIDFRVFEESNIGKNFFFKSNDDNKKLLFFIKSITTHTAIINFSYDYLNNNLYVRYTEIKIYFDSKQVEIIKSSNFKNASKKINNFHALRLSKWYQSYFLSIWLNNCIQNGYLFKLDSEV